MTRSMVWIYRSSMRIHPMPIWHRRSRSSVGIWFLERGRLRFNDQIFMPFWLPIGGPNQCDLSRKHELVSSTSLLRRYILKLTIARYNIIISTNFLIIKDWCIFSLAFITKHFDNEAIKCEELLPPLNGRIVDSAGSHFVGDTVKFSCNRNFLLVGQSDIVCTDEGTWSHPSPQCLFS